MEVAPGEALPASDAPIELNTGRTTKVLQVASTCDRPIQVGSHFHFIETNKYLMFDREASIGMRLNIAAGTSVRFQPGETRAVPLVEIGGNKVVRGGNFLVDGPVESTSVSTIMERVNNPPHAPSFGNKKQKVYNLYTYISS